MIKEKMIMKKLGRIDIFIRILIVIIMVITALSAIIAYKEVTGDFDPDKHDISKEQMAVAEHGRLFLQESFYDEKLGKYIQVARNDTEGDYIAFALDSDDDIVDYAAGSYYTECYFKGEYKTVTYEKYGEVRVYDISSYLGSVKPDNSKKLSVILGKGVGFLVAGIVFVFGIVISCVIWIIYSIIKKHQKKHEENTDI